MDSRLSLKIIEADNFFLRAFGLLFRRPLGFREALHLKPCNAIHTMGMRYAIDVVFLNGESKILEIRNNVGGFRMCRFSAAKSVLEMRAGEAIRLGWSPGMKLECVMTVDNDIELSDR
jgi:uncharacterized protein